MGLLADVYSYGDSMKRKVRGLLSDPLGTIEQGIRNFGEDQNQMLQTMQNAYPIPGNKMANFTPAQIDSFRRQLADQATAQGMAGMTVWHGSPHKFDKFDFSKIGTGEGAQAYGHGGYVAEAQDVAKEYQKILGDMQFHYNGKPLASGSIEDMAAQYIFGQQGNKAAAIEDAFGNKALQNAIKKMDYSKIEKGGYLYKVDLPDEQIAKMLDWDKPLSQQPHVKDALSKEYSDTWLNMFADKPGSDLYKSMSGGLGVEDMRPLGAEELRKAGIPGIRYLDGGSRGTGQGSSNFVIFPQNEGLLTILERNGVPIK